MQEYTVHYQFLVADQLIEDTLVVEAFSEQRAVETVLKRLDEHYYVAILLECQTVSEERCCPCCLEGYMERSTMSRLDNQTEICPTCGILEALAMQ